MTPIDGTGAPGNHRMRTRSDLRHFLKSDRKALEMRRSRPRFLGDEIWKFLICLRHVEYYGSRRGPWSRLLGGFYRFQMHRLGVALGFSIPPGVCGPGLSLAHYGSIVISPAARIRANCRIHSGVNIGVAKGGVVAPRIGDNVYIGPGAKLFGDIRIGDGVAIGANAVVTKSFESGVTIVGVPARVIRGPAEIGPESGHEFPPAPQPELESKEPRP